MTPKEFYAQYQTATPELGKTYYQEGYISSSQWTVLYIDNNVAFCKSPCNYNKGKFNYDMFYATGLNAGWRVNDSRHNYRLIKEI
jgi:hypothetical protein